MDDISFLYVDHADEDDAEGDDDSDEDMNGSAQKQSRTQ